MTSDKVDQIEFGILVGVVVVLALMPTINQITKDITSFDWTKLGIRFAIFLIIAIFLFLLIKKLTEIHKNRNETKDRKKAELSKQEKEFNEMLNTKHKYNSSTEIQIWLNKFETYLETLNNEIKTNYEIQINNFKKEKIRVIKQRLKEEYLRKLQNQRKYQNEIQQKRLFREKVEELKKFKRKKGYDSLPENHNYDSEMIYKAQNELRDEKEDQQRINEIRKEAIKYYQFHDLDTKPHLQNYGIEQIYEEIRNSIGTGKLKLEKPRNQAISLDKDFYQFDELDDELRASVKSHHYVIYPCPNLDGKITTFYIANNKSETNYHFVTKHLFSRLHKNMALEFSVNGRRADIAYISGGLRLAIEIETGSNNPKELAAKKPWLDSNFDQWLFVCSDKLIHRYKSYTDGKKSFCLKPKDAKYKVLKLIDNDIKRQLVAQKV